MPAPEAVDSAAETLRILSDPTRLRILWALSQGESSVACLAELSGANPTSVSQHLAKLRLAGVVRARRQGTYMFYVIVDPQLPKLLETVLAATGPAEKVEHSKAAS
jgi:DNA-binding transcriptional ArsR family regulator